MQRREAKHGLNHRSSRSHTVFTVRLETLTAGGLSTLPLYRRLRSSWTELVQLLVQ